MEGKEAIIARIIGDAEKKACELIENAQKYATEKKSEAEEWSREYSAAQSELLEKELQEIVDRKIIVAELDARKNTLKVKQSLIAEARSRALVKLCSMNKADYIKFIGRLLAENCDEGDTVILSSDGVINSNDIEKLEIFGIKRLSVSKTRGDFKGGIKLAGKICDKDLSFESIIADKSSRISAELAAELFPREN